MGRGGYHFGRCRVDHISIDTFRAVPCPQTAMNNSPFRKSSCFHLVGCSTANQSCPNEAHGQLKSIARLPTFLSSRAQVERELPQPWLKDVWKRDLPAIAIQPNRSTRDGAHDKLAAVVFPLVENGQVEHRLKDGGQYSKKELVEGADELLHRLTLVVLVLMELFQKAGQAKLDLVAEHRVRVNNCHISIPGLRFPLGQLLSWATCTPAGSRVPGSRVLLASGRHSQALMASGCSDGVGGGGGGPQTRFVGQYCGAIFWRVAFCSPVPFCCQGSWQ